MMKYILFIVTFLLIFPIEALASKVYFPLRLVEMSESWKVSYDTVKQACGEPVEVNIEYHVFNCDYLDISNSPVEFTKEA